MYVLSNVFPNYLNVHIVNLGRISLYNFILQWASTPLKEGSKIFLFIIQKEINEIPAGLTGTFRLWYSAMATVPRIVPFNDAPSLDEFQLSSGYPGVELIEKSAQAFDKAASDCMVRWFNHRLYSGAIVSHY